MSTLTAPADYARFLEGKTHADGGCGFEPLWVPDFLFDFQKALVDWSIREGRAAIFADCGLGKTAQQLVWAENVVRHTGRAVLVLTPLAVASQTIREAEKFSIDAVRCGDGKAAPAKINVTNYERLHHFSPGDFAGVVCDESSILKNFDGTRRKQITDFMRPMRYRLLCTATAAPNDFYEMGTSSDALGYLGARDMLTRFFVEDTVKDYLGWGRKAYRFRGHAEEPFWRWVCSWARACRKPSDLGFPDDGFELPPLVERETIIENATPREGMLFAVPARDMREQRQERRVTIRERCEAAARIVHAHDGPSVVWCHLNAEGDALAKMIDGGAQVCGSMSDEEKEEKLVAFAAGQIQRLVTKPKIGCFGLNWQHCCNVVTFPSHSWEQYYQAVRRCWRFGQTKPVTVTVVGTEGERGVSANLRRKADQADRMFAALTEHVAAALFVRRGTTFGADEQLPPWVRAA
jgi:hypothetical protein